MSDVIETRDLSVAFRGVAGVSELNLSVREGEIFGYLGPNGAGKTTTIRLLLDLLRPDSGQAFVLSHRVGSSGTKWRSEIGFVPGDLTLFPWLSGEETLDLFAGLSGRNPVMREEILAALGLSGSARRRKIKTYSTGMRQMIGLCAAMQHDPRLLILDEPTTGLDPIVRNALLALLIERKRKGRTVFFSSHVLDEVETCADRVGFIEGSRLRLVASVKDLRAERPRMVTVRYRDGREQVRTHSGDLKPLLKSLEMEDLLDVEIRPAGLDEVFRTVVTGSPRA